MYLLNIILITLFRLPGEILKFLKVLSVYLQPAEVW